MSHSGDLFDFESSLFGCIRLVGNGRAIPFKKISCSTTFIVMYSCVLYTKIINKLYFYYKYDTRILLCIIYLLYRNYIEPACINSSSLISLLRQGIVWLFQ